MKRYMLRNLCVLIFSALCTVVGAQSSGDKLFLEGQNLQKVLTVGSQNAAIKKFTAAKVVYVTADKKKMCDNQIAVCRSNIKSLSVKKTKKSPRKVKETVEEKTVENTVVEVKKRTDVRLKLSEDGLEFKAIPGEGATQSVDVFCNYDDWAIASCPDWATVYTAKDKFTVEVTDNETSDDRFGHVTVKCEDTEVVLVVKQKKKNFKDKMLDRIKKKKK